MNHTKTLEPIESHRVLTVEEDGIEPTELFRGSKRECQAYINNSNLITLTIEEIA
jgi:hypothetical protein